MEKLCGKCGCKFDDQGKSYALICLDCYKAKRAEERSEKDSSYQSSIQWSVCVKEAGEWLRLSAARSQITLTDDVILNDVRRLATKLRDGLFK